MTTELLEGDNNKDPEQKGVEEENCNRVKKQNKEEWRRRNFFTKKEENVVFKKIFRKREDDKITWRG